MNAPEHATRKAPFFTHLRSRAICIGQLEKLTGLWTGLWTENQKRCCYYWNNNRPSPQTIQLRRNIYPGKLCIRRDKSGLDCCMELARRDCCLLQTFPWYSVEMLTLLCLTTRTVAKKGRKLALV